MMTIGKHRVALGPIVIRRADLRPSVVENPMLECGWMPVDVPTCPVVLSG